MKRLTNFKLIFRLINKKVEKAQITNIKYRRKGISVDHTVIRKIIRECFEHLAFNKFDNLYKMDIFSKSQNY